MIPRDLLLFYDGKDRGKGASPTRGANFSNRHTMLAKLFNFLSGRLTKRTLLFALIPLMFVSYFGALGLATLLFPGTYDWRDASISTLLYPRNNPEFHFFASIGITVTGLLMIPFAGYINRRLRIASPVAANAGTVAFVGGIICLIFAGLIVSHPLHGRSSVPRLHSILARTAALGIGVGMVMFDGCAVRGYFNRATGKKPYRRSLLILWSMATLPVILAVVLKLVVQTRFWHLGFWEWTGSVAAFLFLVCSVWLLPENAYE